MFLLILHWKWARAIIVPFSHLRHVKKRTQPRRPLLYIHLKDLNQDIHLTVCNVCLFPKYIRHRCWENWICSSTWAWKNQAAIPTFHRKETKHKWATTEHAHQRIMFFFLKRCFHSKTRTCSTCSAAAIQPGNLEANNFRILNVLLCIIIPLIWSHRTQHWETPELAPRSKEAEEVLSHRCLSLP